ncbi:MAG: efflux RND transporter periplasmic adaptor subunit [Gammaproteobacteria bacterium]|nr:efflux RND transporter periplasmic adaptor subunit [Gammaproteobacteria bacterium]
MALQRKLSPTRSAAVLALALSALSLGACKWPWSDAATDGAIRLSGTVDAREYDLAFQVGGRVSELAVDEGDVVGAGQVVARLDEHDFTLALERARAEAKAAEAALAALRAGSRTQEVAAARATLDRARAEQRYAEAEVKRMRDLVPRQLASREDLDRAERQRDVAAAGVEEARQRLELLVEGTRPEDIDRAAAEAAARRAAAESAARQLEYATLKSPAAGVVSVRMADLGEVWQPGQAALRVTQLDRPWVRAYLTEPDLARVRIGMPAEVRVDGQPGRVFSGRLTFISPEAEYTPKTVETRALRVDLVYRVKVEVDNPEGLLKVGMPADVTLEPVAAP